MDIPTQIASTTVGLAIKFLFDEVHQIMKERRDRIMTENKPEIKNSTSEENEKVIGLIVQKVLNKPISGNIEKDIKLLLELIEIEKQNRDRAKKQIALQGGFAFASPPTLSALELAEEKIMEHGSELKLTLESFYNIELHYPVL